MQTIDVKELAAKQAREQVRLIDVRTPVEFRSVHAKGAINFPLDTLNPAAVQESLGEHTGETLYVICKSGGRSSKAVEQFENAGFHNVANVDGGTDAWDQAGLPVMRGKKSVSLERQIRIVAGFLALLGAVLSYFHPAFVALSGFIGAGLLFAGVTDTCGMGMMLAKMPWNQCDSESGSCAT